MLDLYRKFGVLIRQQKKRESLLVRRRCRIRVSIRGWVSGGVCDGGRRRQLGYHSSTVRSVVFDFPISRTDYYVWNGNNFITY